MSLVEYELIKTLLLHGSIIDFVINPDNQYLRKYYGNVIGTFHGKFVCRGRYVFCWTPRRTCHRRSRVY